MSLGILVATLVEVLLFKHKQTKPLVSLPQTCARLRVLAGAFHAGSLNIFQSFQSVGVFFYYACENLAKLQVCDAQAEADMGYPE